MWSNGWKRIGMVRRRDMAEVRAWPVDVAVKRGFLEGCDAMQYVILMC